MKDPQKDRLRKYAWDYFSYHAEQRIKTFHFYIVLSAMIFAGFATAIKAINLPNNLEYLSVFGALLSIFSVAFAYLDRRNRELVRNGENALKHLDEQENHERENNAPHVLEIFTLDDHVTENKPRFPLVSSHISYSKVFKFIFITFFFTGIASMYMCLKNWC